jgi:hypothetical protein
LGVIFFFLLSIYSFDVFVQVIVVSSLKLEFSFLVKE